MISNIISHKDKNKGRKKSRPIKKLVVVVKEEYGEVRTVDRAGSSFHLSGLN